MLPLVCLQICGRSLVNHMTLLSSESLGSVMVDPTSLSEGVHYTEVIGMDSGAPWRGPIFRVPITVVKPMEVTARPPMVHFSDLLFMPGNCNNGIALVSVVLAQCCNLLGSSLCLTGVNHGRSS